MLADPLHLGSLFGGISHPALRDSLGLLCGLSRGAGVGRPGV